MCHKYRVGDLGRILVIVGLIIAALGGIFILSQSVPALRIGRLPGDIRIERDGFSFFFPITTMLVLSAVASAVFYLASRFSR